MPNSDETRRVVDIVVHGRFFAFSLAQALAQRGQDVRVFTNYPKVVTARFGVPRDSIVSYAWHGVSSRLLHRAGNMTNRRLMEPWLHQEFGRWAASQVRAESDAVICFSGIAEEVFVRLSQTSGAGHVLAITPIILWRYAQAAPIIGPTCNG